MIVRPSFGALVIGHRRMIIPLAIGASSARTLDGTIRKFVNHFCYMHEGP